RIRHVEREQPSVQQETDQEHQRERRQEHDTLLPASEHHVPEPRDQPRDGAHDREPPRLDRCALTVCCRGLPRCRGFAAHAITASYHRGVNASRPHTSLLVPRVSPLTARTSHAAAKPSGSAAVKRTALEKETAPAYSRIQVTAVGMAAAISTRRARAPAIEP